MITVYSSQSVAALLLGFVHRNDGLRSHELGRGLYEDMVQ